MRAKPNRTESGGGAAPVMWYYRDLCRTPGRTEEPFVRRKVCDRAERTIITAHRTLALQIARPRGCQTHMLAGVHADGKQHAPLLSVTSVARLGSRAAWT